jgi:hypothetical protein
MPVNLPPVNLLKYELARNSDDRYCSAAPSGVVALAGVLRPPHAAGGAPCPPGAGFPKRKQQNTIAMEKKELYESPATVVVVLMSKSFICQSMQTYFKGGYGIVNELDDEEEEE